MICHTTASSVYEVPPVRVIGDSVAMRRVVRAALFAARGSAHVLISGEPGVGKVAIARFIHEHSHRSRLGFRTVNCKDLPEPLIESSLFGHVQGSFAGAYSDKPGSLESVPGGTVVLNDVDALSATLQRRLLRFLETGEYQRIGGISVQTELDVRVIASTTADLPALVNAGLFLEDLYRLLNGTGLLVPPLRERRDDIPSLVDHFAGQLVGSCPCFISGVDDSSIANAMRIAVDRDEWPGNLRELRAVVQRQLIGEVCLQRSPMRVAAAHRGLVH